jgi:hypothetical protein
MKTLIRFLFFVACTSLLVSCSESTQIADDLAGEVLKNASAPPVFVVEPSGGEDTQALYEAFILAKTAGPGSIVQLCEGEYHLGFIEIRDFEGAFRGAGMGKTVITAMNNLNSQLLWDRHQTVNIIKFVGGDVTVSNFTIQTPPGRLSVTGPSTGHIGYLINFASYNALHELRNENRSIKAVIDNVSFKGQPLEGAPGITRGYNCAYAIHAGWECWGLTDLPREKVDITITRSEFDTFYGGVITEGLKNSKVIVGMNTRGNLFKNCDIGIGMYQYRDVEIVAEGNTFDMNPGVTYSLEINDAYDNYYPFFRAETATTGTTCNIGFNVFNLPNSRYAVYINNLRRISPIGEIPSVYQVRNNKFNMTEGYSRAIASYRTMGMVIRNNNFTGYGEHAIYLSTLSEGGLVLGNNFSTAVFKNFAVYLAANTKNWTVVGGNIGDRVNNLGTNNIITGVNVSTSETSLGESISEDLPAMNHIMH